ncbi:phage holin family protein [Agathobaculum sp.]|uniref:phage holin family protein n=1 Tax=Agathobaculum sp. TaxID=2048138 RepID=UPI002A83CD0A|nr:phage holin family protein [Agathobaculum sp.]MDY3618877.1 phage holin family protein [Agathobaculum sp.]
MAEITQYIKPDYTILVAVLYCLGCGLKALKKFPNQWIPLTLTICGMGLACLSALARISQYANLAAALYDGVVQGVLCTGMSVYLNEFVKHCGPGGCGRRK